MSTSGSELGLRYEWGLEALMEASELARGYFWGADLNVQYKGDDSPVTVADRAVEEKFRELLAKEFPNDGIQGEEFPEKLPEGKFKWIIDPIDGTFSFIHGVPLWGSLLALEFEGEVVAGWAYMPELGELITAIKGGGAKWYQGYDIKRGAFRVKMPIKQKIGPNKLQDAVWCHTSSDYFTATNKRSLLEKLETTCAATRCWSDCYGLLLLATGRVDLVVEPSLQYWDYAPFKVIFPEVGLKISDFSGKECFGESSLIAGNEILLNSFIGLYDDNNKLESAV